MDGATKPNRFRLLVADDEAELLASYKAVFDPALPAAGGLQALEDELFETPATPAHEPAEIPCEYHLDVFDQGEPAVEAVRKAIIDGQPYSVAFLDVRMPPGINGIETARQIRALDPDINIVIVTGYSDIHPREIAQQVAPLEKLFYLAKPFKAPELEQLAAALSNKWHSEIQLKDAFARRAREWAQITATISHEIRNPLNALNASLRVIESKTDGAVAGLEPSFSRCQRSMNRCTKVINDMLGFVSELALNRTDTPVDDWLIDVIDQADLPDTLQVECELAANDAVVAIDLDLMRSVVASVLENACHAQLDARNGEAACKAGNKISVKSRLMADSAEICVSDTGAGMDDDTLAKVFEPLYSTRNFGVGLGLPTARKIVEQHGGTIEIASRPGSGTSVTISLPCEFQSSAAGLEDISSSRSRPGLTYLPNVGDRT